MIRVRDAVQAGALGELSGFRQEFYRCLPARADALFELAEAVLRIIGPPGKASIVATARNWATSTKLLSLCEDK